ncbi:hypothetical protein K493DRAFT_315844 [Basidiobolus meristosporus CBS 931.73]|uniref:Uncharacterized protein n=1 Tax=Basidiobolus meristosporus CBS 931.73 TaxID=1314790 RepID=A0A1Y1Y6Z2_9FUNG|nr:hypothetical protein K493DRAFT_315844 [Basidiobolus meristosporus CBS 931.73]|eukprot:ORX93739.1 hypothetical protein K493DRAFT_315844 [Basidiobolus meristosporus CBS 931.73]
MTPSQGTSQTYEYHELYPRRYFRHFFSVISTRTYTVVTFLFSVAYVLTLVSVFGTNWLNFRTPGPFKSNIYYGLWKKCSSSGCRAFPDPDNGDCKEVGFCEKWQMAQNGMSIAGMLGVLILVFFGTVFFLSPNRQARSWKYAVPLLSVHAICQILPMGIIAHLYGTSPRFYFGTTYDLAFLSCIVSWMLDVVCGVILFSIGMTSPPDYEPF